MQSRRNGKEKMGDESVKIEVKKKDFEESRKEGQAKREMKNTVEKEKENKGNEEKKTAV
jgi:hypothetical protein